MVRILFLGVAALTAICSSPIFAGDYLIHIESRGYQDFVGDGDPPNDRILSASQFVVSPNEPFRTRFSHGRTLVTVKGIVKFEFDGTLKMDVTYNEQREELEGVNLPGDFKLPRLHTSRSQTTASGELGEPILLGGALLADETTTPDGSPPIRTRSKRLHVVRVTEFKPDELTPEEVEEQHQYRLLGVWNATELVRNGLPADADVIKQLEFKFEKGSLTVKGLDAADEIRHYDMELDASRPLKRLIVTPIDTRWKGVAIGAIYEFQRGVLRIAIPEIEAGDPPAAPNAASSGFEIKPKSQDFPRNFESTVGSKLKLITLKQTIGIGTRD